jgi:hypothetical protein
MKQEDALKMIELCLEGIMEQQLLTDLIQKIVERKMQIVVNSVFPKKREYKRKETINEQTF